MTRTKLFKLGLSGFILFHLVCIIIYPNPSSVLARVAQPYINWYGNSLGLNTTWQFFSPDPGALRYIQYQVVVEKKDDIDIHNYRWPPKDVENYWTNNLGRRFYHGIRTVMSEEKRTKYLVPFLCRLHPEASSIAIKTVQDVVPSIERARVNDVDLSEDTSIDIPVHEVGCKEDEFDS